MSARLYTLHLTRDELEVVRCFLALGAAYACKEEPAPATEQVAKDLSHTDALQRVAAKIMAAYDGD